MVNNLSTVEKNLRSIAKRYENVKYSVGLAVLFLMKGTSAFSDDNKIQEIERKKDILTNDQVTKAVVKKAKAKKQVTQKLKASWATMQFASNDMYSNFFVAPKTQVDKDSIVKAENTILLASADNNTSLPTFSKIASDIEETYALTTEEINTSKGNLRNSIGNLQNKINEVRKENAKEVQGLKLELVQLMEQGNQVVKSPWSSWQFGANYIYNNWSGAYKGRGDKLAEGSIINRSANSLDPLAKNIVVPDLKSFNYNITNLNIMEEPNATITINPKFTPVIIEKNPELNIQEKDLFGLPYFKDRNITIPKIPTLVNPFVSIPRSYRFRGAWINGVNGVYSYWHTDNSIGQTDGNLYQTSVEKGEVLKRKWGAVNNIQLKNYQRGQIQVRAINRDVGVEPPENANITNDEPTFFMSLEDIPYSYFGKDANIATINESELESSNSILIHFETEGNTNDKFDKLKTDGHITEEEFNEIRKYTTDTDFRNDDGGELYHVNRGNVELGGRSVRYIQTTFAWGLGKRVNLIENRGSIVGMNYEEGNIKTHSNVIFLYGPDTDPNYTGTQHIYANNKTGKISLYGEKSYVGVFTADGRQLGRGDVSFINDGEINLYGRSNVGLYIAEDDRGKLTTKSNFIMNKPINLQGDNSTGLYVENSGEGLKNPLNTVRFVIGAKDNTTIPTYIPKNSLLNPANIKKAYHNKEYNDENLSEEIFGVILKNPDAELHLKVPQLEIERFAKKSVGLYTREGLIKVTEGNIEIKGGENNTAISAYGGNIDYTGNITIKESSLDGDTGNKKGIKNLAVLGISSSSRISHVKINGDINTDTRDTVTVYSINSKIDLNGKLNLKLRPEETGQNIAIYAKDSTATTPITVQTNQSKIEIIGKKDDGSITNQGLALYAERGGQILANGTSLSDGLYMKITDAASAIFSNGSTSNIETKYSTIDYDSRGYALYTKNGGKIDVSDSKINLYGESTGFERDGNLANPSSITLTGTKFYAHSDDVAIMSLKDVPSLTYSTLAGTFLQNYLGGAEVYGVNGVKNYKLGIIDGLNSFDIDSDYDKSKAFDPANIGTNDYVLTRQLLIKRAKINLKSGNKINAILSSNEITDIGEKTAVGLATGGSGYSPHYTNAESQINLEANTSVNVDRTDKGTGSVGLFTNYGQINVDLGAEINVEKENNVVNDMSVGIYAVNGSEVKNNGTVNVGGNKSIGMLGMPYRIDTNANPIFTDDFGHGRTRIYNESTGLIKLDGEESVGMFMYNNSTSYIGTTSNNLGTIEMSGNKAIGMLVKAPEVNSSTYNYGTININSDQEGIGMVASGEAFARNDATGLINLKSSSSKYKPNIGMFTNDKNSSLANYGNIIGGDNNYGMYGNHITHNDNKIKLGNNSVGIFSSTKDNYTYFDSADGEIEVGNNSTAVFVSGDNNSIMQNTSKITIGDNSFGFVLKTNGSTLENDYTQETKLGNESVYIYSSDKTGTITNSTPLKTTGNKNYGIYATGNVTNLADMNLGSGIGNIGMYALSDGRIINGELGAVSQPTITVGKGDISKDIYSIGMVAEHSNNGGANLQTRTIENYGKIDVVDEGGIGMYAAGSGSKAINHVGAEINLSGQDSIGMYLTDSAIGENYGTIRTAPNNTKDGIIGVLATNNALIKNYGTIEVKGEKNTGIYLSNEATKEGNDPINLDGAEGVATKKFQPTGKKIKGLEIETLKNEPTTITRDGEISTPVYVDTIPTKPNEVMAGSTTLELKNTSLGESPSLTRASSLGMYIDTSGRRFTNPIQGLEHLTNLKEINLIFGVEATNYTNSKDIQVGENILEPYNSIIPTLSRRGKTKFNLNSGSLTWIATGTQDKTTDKFNAIYLSKIPYTDFSKEEDVYTYNFLDGLEQRYGIEALGSREKTLFDKLNAIGKGEPVLFAQAVDQMKGYQYSNTQQRVQATGDILDKEFDYLRNEWSNLTKDSNKIKTFGAQGEYKTNTAGVEDYKSNAYGVAYVHEDETVRLGESTGWYAGIVHNKLKFKDLGNSKEEMLQGKLGAFKSVPFDENNSLNWIISGDVSVGYNKMHRKYLVVDEIFNAKSKYQTYGLGLKNKISKEFRLSESFTFKPYAALGLEYGRVSKISEKSGEMKLEIKANDYFSVKPEIGTELAYKHHFGTGAFKASVGVAYENELGRVANAKNKARVANTSADWYDLRGEKEDRKGNVKVDLNIGLESERYGVTASVGYDTKGENLRGGVGLRVKF